MGKGRKRQKKRRREPDRALPTPHGFTRRKFGQWIGQAILYLAAITTIVVNLKQLLPPSPPSTVRIPPASPTGFRMVAEPGIICIQGTATATLVHATATSSNANAS